jgi:hypothetical protein
MLRVLLVVATAAVLGAAEPSQTLRVDHVTVAGTDLKKMQASLAAIGIRSEYGGPHSNHATEMALTSFPDGSYLELIAIQPNADPKAVAAHYWSTRMQKDARPTAWAAQGTDITAEVMRLNDAGIVTGGPTRAGRARPDGVKLDWEAATVGPEPNGMFFPFLIHDFTPREQRVFPSGKPTMNEFAGIAKVVIAVRDLNAAVERYRKAYGFPEPVKQDDASFGAHLAGFAGTPVVLAAPLTAQSWLNARITQVGEGPCVFVLHAEKIPTLAKSKTHWFGNDVAWFDVQTLGWHLGVEKSQQ